ncbi:MAG: EAL domain-containing protein [Spirochaetales bacterium]|nr:EAL domain-containing protein [Spirochaetales bacterium]
MLEIFTIAMIVQTSALLFMGISFWIIYIFEKKKSVLFIAIAHSVLTLQAFFKIIYFSNVGLKQFSFISIILTIFFVFFILKGTVTIKKSINYIIFFLWGGLITLTVLLVSILSKRPDIDLVLTFIFSGIIYIFTGFVTRISATISKKIKTPIATLYLIWGILAILFAFFYKMPILAGISYFTIFVIQIAISLFVLIHQLRAHQIEIENNQKKYETIFNAASDTIFLLKENKIIECNKAAERLFKRSREEIIGMSPGMLSPPYQAGGASSFAMEIDFINNAYAGKTQIFEWQHQDLNGHIIDTEISVSKVEIGNTIVLLAIVRDITRIKKAQDFIEISSKVFSKSIEALIITDKDGTIEQINKAFTAITGYTEDDVIGQKASILKSSRHDIIFYKEMWESITLSGEWEGEVWNRRKNGEIFPAWLNINAIYDINQQVKKFAGLFHDITDLKRSKHLIEYKNRYDELTDLPNRETFIKYLKAATSDMKKYNKKIAVLAVDIKNFKSINENYGHKKGDLLLIDFIKRVQEVKGFATTISRLGGDEFLILLEEVKNTDYVEKFTKNLIEILKYPFSIEDSEIFIQINIGISIPEDYLTAPEILIKQADTALHKSKDDNSEDFTLFTKSMNQKVIKRYTLESSLRRALMNKELEVYYQPQLELSTMKVKGCEALIRWQTDEGFIPPADFIPIAEENNLILEITEFLLEIVCRDLEEIRGLGYPDFFTSINLSARHFDNEKNIKNIIKIIENSKIDFEHIEFEITESSFIENSNRTIAIINKLRDKGSNFSLDDFGTGYSSLSYLQNYPIDKLKIDKSFIDFLPNDKRAVAMFKAIIDMAYGLGLKVIAEGTEKDAQIDFIKNLGCDLIQGYWFSPPVKKQVLISVIEANKHD